MRWTPRRAHLLAQVGRAVIHGDLMEKLRTYRTEQVQQIAEHITKFPDILRRAVDQNPAVFNSSSADYADILEIKWRAKILTP